MLEPMFEIVQTMPNSVEIYVWCGEKPRRVWHSPGRVTKYRKEPATIEAGNLQRATPQDAQELATVLLLCAQLARDLDTKYSDGVPDITEYLPKQEEATIKDRILATIDGNGVSYRSSWSIADELGIPRLELQGHHTPTTEYEQALYDLVQEGVLEEVPDLSYRYRRVKERDHARDE